MRLTEKYEFGYKGDCQQSCQCSDKLGQLEDIEEELDIDLLTLFKALKQGYIIDVFFNEEVRSMDVSGEQSLLVDFSNKCFYDCFISNAGKYDKCYYFKDYGKTWALTKEELK